MHRGGAHQRAGQAAAATVSSEGASKPRDVAVNVAGPLRRHRTASAARVSRAGSQRWTGRPVSGQATSYATAHGGGGDRARPTDRGRRRRRPAASDRVQSPLGGLHRKDVPRAGPAVRRSGPGGMPGSSRPSRCDSHASRRRRRSGRRSAAANGLGRTSRRRGRRRDALPHASSRMVAFAMPPPSHIVCRP
jgi:hypothetical protein